MSPVLLVQNNLGVCYKLVVMIWHILLELFYYLTLSLC